MKVSRLADRSPEIFHTLQGEGSSLGAPAVFLRLSQCNLHCHWCDTPYTWNWEGTPWQHQDEVKFKKVEQIIELPPSEIAPLILDHNCDRLVITGGEPLLQQAEIAQLLDLLPSLPYIEFETNGTQVPKPEIIRPSVQFNVSPKLANSGMKEEVRIKPDALRFFRDHQNSLFKFVVCNSNDLSEVLDIQSTYEIPSSRIHLMPEGRDPDTLKSRSLWLADICRDHGFRFSPRLHVLLWGNERAK